MEDQCKEWLHFLGLLALSYLVLKQLWVLLVGFKNHILSRWWRTNLKKYGGWAVVTGATDGIGKSYAMELARRGFDVVLISRSLEKLRKVADDIERESRRKTKIIQVDFTGGPEIYPKVEKALKDLDIGILVNNVGMTYSKEGARLLDVPNVNKQTEDIMNCNVLSMVKMTTIVLPRMVQRKKGLIINISSAAGERPYPQLTMYCATKAFMDFFSRSLNLEYRSDGITVQSVLPYLVISNMTRLSKANLVVKTSDDFVREALSTVGYSSRTNGCLSHCIQSYILDLVLTDTVMNSRICRFIAACGLGLLTKILKVQ